MPSFLTSMSACGTGRVKMRICSSDTGLAETPKKLTVQSTDEAGGSAGGSARGSTPTRPPASSSPTSCPGPAAAGADEVPPRPGGATAPTALAAAAAAGRDGAGAGLGPGDVLAIAALAAASVDEGRVAAHGHVGPRRGAAAATPRRGACAATRRAPASMAPAASEIRGGGGARGRAQQRAKEPRSRVARRKNGCVTLRGGWQKSASFFLVPRALTIYYLQGVTG